MPVDDQNLRPEDARNARRRARCGRRHGRLRVLSAVAAPRRLEAARALGARVRGRAQKVALSVDADDAALAAIIEALKPDMLQLHGKETPERVAAVRSRFGLPVMKALPIETRADLVADPALRQRRRPAALRCAPAARRDPARRARQALRLASAASTRSRRSVHAFGRPRCRRTSPRRCASRGRRRSTFPPGSSARRARRTRTRSAPSFAPRGRGSRHAQGRERRMTVPAATELVPHRARRARPLRHLWRPLRRRDADAAHSRSGEGLRGGEGRSGFQEARWTAISTHYVGRPSPLYFAERHDRASRRRENLFQARGAQPHRRAQGEQRARPDPARAAHGQDARHRRDRRRHARRRDRDPVREVRPPVRRLHGRGRRRAAEAERVPHAGARRRSAAGRSRARRRSRTR